MSKTTKQIKWRVCGDYGMDRKGDYQGFEVRISYYHTRRYFQIEFNGQRFGRYGYSDEEMQRAKDDAEKLMPDLAAALLAERQVRKDAEIAAAQADKIRRERLQVVLARLQAIGLPVADLFGSVALKLSDAEALADVLENSGLRLAIVAEGNVAA